MPDSNRFTEPVIPSDRRQTRKILSLLVTIALLGIAAAAPHGATALEEAADCSRYATNKVISAVEVAKLMTRRVEPDDPLFGTARIHAAVTVRVFLGMDGRVMCSRVLGKSNPLLAKASMRAVSECRFKPLSTAGYTQPVQGDVVFQIDR